MQQNCNRAATELLATPEAQPACSRGVWEAEVGLEVGGRFELAEASSARRSRYRYALQCRWFFEHVITAQQHTYK
jgi:hypothetical protein